MNSPLGALASGAARGGGAALAATTGGIGRALRRIKPLHPEGTVHRATVAVAGASSARTGIPWVDETGEYAAYGRISRACGLPRPLPDIAGLAIRIDLATGPADLLLASTGTSAAGRFVLLPRLSGRTGSLTSLLPYRAPVGPLCFAATAINERTYSLAWAIGASRWRPFAELCLREAEGDPADLSFDPVVNAVPGLEQYSWVRRLREPAYRNARTRSAVGASRRARRPRSRPRPRVRAEGSRSSAFRLGELEEC